MNKNIFKKSLLAISLGLSFIAPQTIASNIELSGFGNAIYGKSDNNSPQSGVNNKGTFGALSNIGVKAIANVSKTTSITTQIVTREEYGDSIKTDVDVAFIKYKFSNTFSLSTGKIRTPINMESESLYNTYNSTWVLSPSSVYKNNVPSSFTGINLAITKQFSGVNIQGQLFVGDAKENVRLNHTLTGLKGKIQTNSIEGIFLNIYNSEHSVYASHIESDINFKFSPITQLGLPVAINADQSLEAELDNLSSVVNTAVTNLGYKTKVNDTVTLKTEAFYQNYKATHLNTKMGYYIALTKQWDLFDATITYAQDLSKVGKGSFKNIQEEIKLTSSYHFSPRTRFSAEYSHVNSNSSNNLNFDTPIHAEAINMFLLGIHFVY